MIDSLHTRYWSRRFDAPSAETGDLRENGPPKGIDLFHGKRGKRMNGIDLPSLGNGLAVGVGLAMCIKVRVSITGADLERWWVAGWRLAFAPWSRFQGWRAMTFDQRVEAVCERRGIDPPIVQQLGGRRTPCGNESRHRACKAP